MSHKQMIAWLDQANSTAVQGVADRLSGAAKEISKIGEELKIRPQIVKWKGDGAESFRTWSADLANSTLRLGEFSREASKRLGEAADAIALAKAAIPRPTGDPEASLKAAESARNDPDSADLIRKLNGEREAAAAEMRKLSQTYSHSVAQLDGLKRPTFPPPPAVVVPKNGGGVDDSTRHLGSTASGVGTSTLSPEIQSPVHRPTENTPRSITSAEALSPTGSPPPATSPVRMSIDSVVARPEAPAMPTTTPVLGQAGGGRPDVGLPPVIGGTPPLLNKRPVPLPPTSGPGRPVNPVRPSLAMPGPSGPGNGQVGRPSPTNGIVGGRPVPQAAGRPVAGLPRGTVVGGEGANGGRAPMSHGPGGAVGGGQSGTIGGRRLAGEVGGMVGGRPQQPGQSGARPFTPGGTGLVRGTASGEGARSNGAMGRGAVGSQRAGESRRDEGSERPDYLTEDEETWQRGARRVVPPVID
ncbi:hypothetical protein [Streptomyces sp. ADI98-10]|uniref:hypothetical protein n=1 Tax=Streptomyces sp. ADI98-10 TaxID=1522763 RepID=UPI0013DD9F36|nr:hypothetical protein [Streptomyces sp. ADI98-10]